MRGEGAIRHSFHVTLQFGDNGRLRSHHTVEQFTGP